MKTILALFAGLMIFNLTGCTSQPKLAPILTMPDIPVDQTEIIETNIKFKQKNNLNEQVVQHRNHKIKPNSSIVINVPSNLFDQLSKENENKQDFKTEDFFNIAEQQIEKVLISKGFRVLSRSKFEAKLRTLRDETRCNINEFRCLRSQIAPELQPILDNLKVQLDTGKISALKFSNEVQLFREKFQTSSAGRRRSGKEKELTDISEVIRAAESGNVKADYILQINEFDTNQKLNASSNLQNNQQIRNFIRNHPEISEGFSDRNSRFISCAVSGANLNAKLIYVKTGEIVWIGEHHLDEFSSGVQEVMVEIGSRKYASNVEEINKFISNQNTYQARIKRYGKKINIPDFEYKDALVKPMISSGSCNKNWNSNSEIKTQLSRQVAKDLINTIRVY